MLTSRRTHTHTVTHSHTKELNGSFVKKMSFVVMDIDDEKTIYAMKELTYVGDANNYEGRPHGVHSLGNEFRVLRLLHDISSKCIPGNSSSSEIVQKVDEARHTRGNKMRVLRKLQRKNNDSEKESCDAQIIPGIIGVPYPICDHIQLRLIFELYPVTLHIAMQPEVSEVSLLVESCLLVCRLFVTTPRRIRY